LAGASLFRLLDALVSVVVGSDNAIEFGFDGSSDLSVGRLMASGVA
jgi:hypothetical protein